MLPRGDYVVKTHCDGATSTYAIHLRRGETRELSPRFFSVPVGFVVIGLGTRFFAFQRDPVSVREYLQFLNDSAEIAVMHVPRLADGRVYLQQVDGRWTVPERDAEGGVWDLDWPMILASHQDAEAYVEWWSQKHAFPARLPTIDEWEFAARGELERLYPWGQAFDPSFCVMRESSRQPKSLRLPTDDVGPFGVRHMAGNISNWTSTRVEDRFAYKGASYNSMASMCLLDTTASAGEAERHLHIGIRLLIDL